MQEVAWFTQFGYVAVFVAVALQNAGLPAPGLSILLASSLAAERGLLSLPLVFGVATIAALSGQALGYRAGVRGGPAVLGRLARKVRPERLDAALALIRRRAVSAVLVSRFVPVLRVFGGFAAGACGVPWGTFLGASALGATAWSALVIAAGLGASGTFLGRVSISHALWLAACVLVGAMLLVGARRLRMASR